MTNRQLFNAFSGVKEKYLAEMLDDEPQRALELRPVKRSPVKKAVIAVIACAAAAGIVFSGLALSGKINIPVLFGGSKNIVLQKDGIGEGNSILLKNFRIHDDWLKDYPAKAEELRGSADEEYTTVSAELQMSFADWEKLQQDEVEIHVRILADGKPIKFFDINDYLYYDYSNAVSEGVDWDSVFEVNTHNYTKSSMYIFSKDIPEPDNISPAYLIYKEMNTDPDSDMRIYQYPIAFDIKKGTRQITVIAEYRSETTLKRTGTVDLVDGCYYTKYKDLNMYSNIAAATYSTETIMNGTADSGSGKIYSFAPNGLGTFTAERGGFDPDYEAMRIFTSNRCLTINADGLSADTPYYLTALLDGQPLFDEEYSLLIDPKAQKEFTFKIPERLIKRDGDEKTLWLLAIPVVDGKKYADGVICSVPVSEKYFFTAGRPTKGSFFASGLLSEFGGENFDSVFDADNDILLTISSDKTNYSSGETIRVKARIDNLSEKPVELKQYVTADPYGTENVISPIIAEFNESQPIFIHHDFKNDKLSGQSLVLEPGETYYREFTVDSSLLSTENQEYRITVSYNGPRTGYQRSMYLEIELNGED